MITRQYDFASWYAKLVADALQRDIDDQAQHGTRNGYSAHVRIKGNEFWRKIYESGVAPNVSSVISFADGTDDPFNSLATIAA